MSTTEGNKYSTKEILIKNLHSFFLFKYMSQKIVSTIHLYDIYKSHYIKIYCNISNNLKTISKAKIKMTLETSSLK